MESPKVTLSVLISPELLDRIKKAAAKENKQLSVYVREDVLDICFPAEESALIAADIPKPIEQKKEIKLVEPLEDKEENLTEKFARLKKEMKEEKKERR